MTHTVDPPEETLDPEDWGAIRELGHRMLDEMLEYLATLRERPAWRPVPEDVRERLAGRLPEEAKGLASAYRDFTRDVLPYPTGNLHPRFWGWVRGTGTVEGMLAEMLAAGLNNNVSGFDDAATIVETQVLDWCKAMLGFPGDASGLLVSGCSMANLVGLTVARSARAGFDVRRAGLSLAPQRLVLYASRETHSSVTKAVELLGLGSDALRAIDVDQRFQIDLGALEAAIAADRAAGLRPFAVVGNAGTVNTGAIDDLDGLADLCAREGLWLHVDGAFGVWAMLSETHASSLRSLARADSLAFDLHKWMYVPYEVGCALVRSRADHHATFRVTADYLASGARGADAGPLKLSEYGLQLSREFRALKVWMTLKAHGRRKLARLIQQNLDQAAHLARLVDEAPDLERMAPVPLNIVCFRFSGSGLSDEQLDALNREVLYRLHEDGLAVPSATVIGGRLALRVAITNHRSRRSDFEQLTADVCRLGRELAHRH